MILEALPEPPGFGLSHFLNGGYKITYPKYIIRNESRL